MVDGVIRGQEKVQSIQTDAQVQVANGDRNTHIRLTAFFPGQPG